MGATRVYGIPRVSESREIFYFNNGQGSLPIRFTGGIPDPKYDIPATYVTSNEFEQLVIEHDVLFGRKVFRFDERGNRMESIPVLPETTAGMTLKKGKNTQKNVQASVDDTKEYPNVENIGQATEVLIDLGAKADELGGKDAVISAMVRYKVSFPNIKF